MLGLGWQELLILVVVIVLIAGIFGIGSMGRRNAAKKDSSR